MVSRAPERFRRMASGVPFRAVLVEETGREAVAAGLDVNRRVCRLYAAAGTAFRQMEMIVRVRDGRKFRLLGPAAQPPAAGARLFACALCEEVTEA